MAIQHLNRESIEQYQFEERTMITYRLATSRYRMKELLDCMTKDTISTPEKIEQLKKELSALYTNQPFEKCRSMGDIVKTQLKQSLQKHLKLVTQSPDNPNS